MAVGLFCYKKWLKILMKKDVFTYIIGGKAGQGTKKAGIVAANIFADLKREVFQMNDYPSQRFLVII
jgi:hypothetical protein